MIGVNNADVIVKVNELQDIDPGTLLNALEEMHCGYENAPFYILFYNVAKDEEKVDAKEAEAYAAKTFDFISETTGIVYSEQFKNAIVDSFVLMRDGNFFTLDERIAAIEKLVEKYKDAKVGSIVWFMMEYMKRDLLGLCSVGSGYISKMKEMIAEVKPNDSVYRNMLKRI